MKDLPISITEPTLARIRALRLTTIRRPSGLLSQCQAGDRLWVREPFHLAARWNDLAPTAAAEHGAEPIFAIDGMIEGAGRRRFARQLPRCWHRMHLVLTSVEDQHLQDISDEKARAEGFASRADFASGWNSEHAATRTIGGALVRWSDNPPVTVLHFRPVFAPLPVTASQAAA